MKNDLSKIEVTVRFFANLKEISNKRNVTLQVEIEKTINQLLEILFEMYSPLKEEILDESGNLREYYVILKNGRKISIFEGMDTKLENGDVIAIFPPAAGGIM
ncbi:MAG: ubiquitin-like small modifier protein 1 [Candidatus Hodarchaeales archaeon]|jgi:MoaD family protein